MNTEVWYRNPSNYVREMLEAGQNTAVWDRGHLVTKNLDPGKFLSLYYGAQWWRALIVGNVDQGTVEIDPDHTASKPAAVYPNWSYEDGDIDLLEELLANPVGEDVDACSDKSVPIEARPVLGQEHRVVILDLPSMGTGPGRRFIRELDELQREYPQAVVHVHALYSFRVMFGLHFRAVDVDARTPAAKGKVTLPNGKEMSAEMTVKVPQWINLLGFSPVDLQVPANRCIYNIRSAAWAAQHYKSNFKFRVRGSHDPLPDTPKVDFSPAVAKRGPISKKTEDGDKFLCDVCSVQDSCKYFRQGAVCSVPNTEPARLANFFKSRDSDTIIDGLTTLLAAQANRVERGVEDEELSDELDPEVTKLMNSLFANGVKLAKLVNPALNGGTKIAIGVSGQGAQVQVGATAQQMTAAVIAQLEAKGIPRSQITPEMIKNVLDPSPERAAIETTATIEAEREAS